MAKSTKKRPARKAPKVSGPQRRRKPDVVLNAPRQPKSQPDTNQSKAIALLRSGSGTSIAALTEVTGWQQHSVRGFLAGVVRKRLGLELESSKADGTRLYRIVGSSNVDSGSLATAQS